MKNEFVLKDFIIITLLVSIWVNASEVFRYFVIVRPEMHDYLAAVSNVAEMNFTIFAVWGIWDTIVTGLFVFLFWLCSQVFGNNYRTIILAGFVSWGGVFLLFWVGLANMNLSSWFFLCIVLPLALLETLVAAYITSKLHLRKNA